VNGKWFGPHNRSGRFNKTKKSVAPTGNRAPARQAGNLVTVHVCNIVVGYRIGVLGFLRILDRQFTPESRATTSLYPCVQCILIWTVLHIECSVHVHL
jgi:hypothetical protein